MHIKKTLAASQRRRRFPPTARRIAVLVSVARCVPARRAAGETMAYNGGAGKRLAHPPPPNHDLDVDRVSRSPGLLGARAPSRSRSTCAPIFHVRVRARSPFAALSSRAARRSSTFSLRRAHFSIRARFGVGARRVGGGALSSCSIIDLANFRRIGKRAVFSPRGPRAAGPYLLLL